MNARPSYRRLTIGQVHAAGTAALALAILAAVGVASPALLGFAERARAAAAAAAAAEELTRARSELAAATDERAAIAEASRRRTEAGLPPVAASLEERVVALSQLAADARVSVESIEPGAPAGAGETVTPLAVSGHARYLDAIAFLRSLRAVAPDLAVESVQFSPSGGDGCAFRLSLSHRAPAQAAPVADGRMP